MRPKTGIGGPLCNASKQGSGRHVKTSRRGVTRRPRRALESRWDATQSRVEAWRKGAGSEGIEEDRRQSLHIYVQVRLSAEYTNQYTNPPRTARNMVREILSHLQALFEQPGTGANLGSRT